MSIRASLHQSASDRISTRQSTSVDLPFAAHDEVAADDEDQGDDARTQGRTCAGQRPASRTTDRLTTTGAASLTSGSTRPARGSRQTPNTDRSRGTVGTPASG